MAMSVDGLVSGLSTTDIVNQLMQVEALPQTALKNKVTAQNKAVTAYQDINTKLAALTTAAKALESDDAWNAVKASSSSDAAIVTTTSAASAGTLSFKVEQLAAAHTVTYNQDSTKWVTSTSDAAQPVISGASFVVVDTNGTPVTLTPSNRSLQAVINEINDTPDLPYKAAAVQIEPGKYTLQLTAVESGVDGQFLLADLDPAIDLGTPDEVTQGQNARIRIGMTNPYPIESASNTFTDVVTGVNIAVTKETGADLVTVSLVSDKDGLADKVQAMVDAANAALKEIKTATAPKSALAGDPALRALGQEILSAVATGTGSVGSGSLATVGITVERGGTLAFNKNTFSTAYTADPAGTRAYLDDYDEVPHVNADNDGFDPGWDTANGIARKLSTIGLRATDGIVLPDNPTGPREGIVSGLIKRRNDTIASLTDQVEAWDARLSVRRAALQRQYTALEVALGKLKDQQSWLTGQLAGL